MINWRRSYAPRPEALTETDERYPGRDRRYAGLTKEQLPKTESLQDTLDRLLPYWEGTIAPEIKAGKQILIATHGNNLRALIKHLEKYPTRKSFNATSRPGYPSFTNSMLN